MLTPRASGGSTNPVGNNYRPSAFIELSVLQHTGSISLNNMAVPSIMTGQHYELESFGRRKEKEEHKAFN